MNSCGVRSYKIISPDSEFNVGDEFIPLHFQMSMHTPTTIAHTTVKE